MPPLSPPKYDSEGRLTNERRVPDEYLISLFGPRVPEVLKMLQEEREKRRRGEGSELLDILIAYRHEEMFTLDAEYYQSKDQSSASATPVVQTPGGAAGAALSECAVMMATAAQTGGGAGASQGAVGVPVILDARLQERLDNLQVAAGNQGDNDGDA